MTGRDEWGGDSTFFPEYLYENEKECGRAMSSLNCTHIDHVIYGVADAYYDIHESDMPPFTAYLVPVSLLLLSLSFSLLGNVIFRPAIATLTCVAAFVIVYRLMSTAECSTRLVIGGSVSLCALVISLCVLQAGLFLVGVVAFGACSHAFLDAVHIDYPGGFPVMGSHNLLHWAIVVVASTVGGLTVHFGKKYIFIVVTSILGGVGVSLSISMIVRTSVNVWIWFIVSATCSLVGAIVQYKWTAHICDAKPRRDQATLASGGGGGGSSSLTTG